MSDEKPRKLPLLHRFTIALVVALVTGEIVARVVDARAGRTLDFYLGGDPQREMFELHPFIGYVPRPETDRHGNIEAGGQWIHQNALGMRGPEIPIEKPPGVYRIFCLGGSTTFGSGASRDETTYPKRLEHYLNEQAPPGVTYEVDNCGVNGYSTVENLIYLELRLVEYHPDAIVIYQAANDARSIQARGFRPDYTHMRRAWTDTQLVPFDEFMVRHVRLYAWATRGIDPEEQVGNLNNPLFVPNFKDLHQPSDQGVPEEGIDVFFRNLEHMIWIARGHGIQPVLSTFAMCREKKKPNDEDFLETVRVINERMEPFAEEQGVPVLHIAEALDGHCELFDDWMHMDDAGCDLHGRTAAEEARRLGLFGLE